MHKNNTTFTYTSIRYMHSFTKNNSNSSKRIIQRTNVYKITIKGYKTALQDNNDEELTTYFYPLIMSCEITNIL